ncbi:MAG: hypothetical protein GY929_01625 [Actinomycetia bacterium]|nr:hypothetical protein [Actinomycetes bacterium]
MSVPVDLSRLAEKIEGRGPSAYLMTGAGEGPPRISHVEIEVTDGSLSCLVGQRAASNIGEHPSVSLLWPARTLDDHNLIVDATATFSAGTATITPTFAVLHRNAAADTDCGSDCLALDQQL